MHSGRVQRLLYVASRPHSGSTLFTMMMAHHPQIVGLGGIDRAVRMLLNEPESTAERPCTCGMLTRDCVYWGAVLRAITRTRPQSLGERYRTALAVFSEVFGRDAWPIDAGQITEPVYTLASLDWLEMRLVHLVRDVRSAVISQIDSRERKGKQRRSDAIFAIITAWRWWRENEKIERCRRETRLPGKGLGYEELCLNFRQAFDSVCDFLELPRAEASPEVPRINSHMFIGNRMRMQEEKRRLIYDGRWLARDEWMSPSVLLPFVMRRNGEWVYGNNIFSVFTAQPLNLRDEK